MPICIIGMHRSGTSMVARLLNLCGVHLGGEDELIPASADNLAGYWENRNVVAINDEILRVAGGSWQNPPMLTPGWSQQEQFDPFREAARQLAASLAEHDRWGWKDPRSSLTYEFWQDCFPDLQPVICVRNPIEVGMSLQARKLRFVEGVDYDPAVELWDTYYRSISRFVPPEKSIIVHYESFFYDPEAELRRLTDFLGLEYNSEAPETIRKGLHRNRLPDHLAADLLPNDIFQTYQRLCDQSGPVYERLIADTDYTETASESAILQVHKQLRGEQSFFIEQKAQLLNEIEILADVRQQHEAEIRQLAEKNQEFLTEIHILADVRQKHEAQINQLARQLSGQIQEMAATQQKTNDLNEQIAGLQALLALRDDEFQRLVEQVHQIDSLAQIMPHDGENIITPLPLDAHLLSDLHLLPPLLERDDGVLGNHYREYIDLEGAEPGDYELLIQVTDEQGNTRIETRRVTIDPSPVLLSIDMSPEGQRFLGDGKLSLNGWAYSEAAPITAIEVYVKETYLGELEYGIPRDDVAQVFDNPQMRESGYMGKVRLNNLPPGEHQVIVQAVDSAGNCLRKIWPITVIDENLVDDDARVRRSIQQFHGVSIVIPVFNAIEYTKACIESIYQAQSAIPFEVIVVNNGSEDGTREWLDDAERIYPRFYRAHYEQNMGFAKAVNLGMQNARGRYVVILNNDTLVTPHWLDHLVEAAESDKTLGIVSPMTNYVGEGPQIDPDAEALPPHEAENFAIRIRHRKEKQIVPDRLVFFCVLLKREVIDLLGGLDEGFLKGNFEDDDFCLRARLAGYKLAIVRNAFVYHHGSRTFTGNKLRHNQWMTRNRIHYLEKLTRLASAPPRMRPQSPPDKPIDVSVVVRTLNRPDALELALTSLANQTFENFEVVLVNDGGDDTPDLVERFAAYFPINYIRNDAPTGRTPALNQGVLAANGRYLTYLDDDDVVYPQHLDVLWHTLHQNSEPGKFAYSNFNRVLVTDYGKRGIVVSRVPVAPWKYNRDELLVHNYIPIHTWLHDRACIDEVGLFNESLDSLEDWEFLIRVAEKYDFLYSSRTTCEYRFYQGGTNSIVRQRSKALDSLHYIYGQYPVDRVALAHERQKELEANHALIETIAEIEDNLRAEPEREAEYFREILSKVVGFEVVS